IMFNPIMSSPYIQLPPHEVNLPQSIYKICHFMLVHSSFLRQIIYFLQYACLKKNSTSYCGNVTYNFIWGINKILCDTYNLCSIDNFNFEINNFTCNTYNFVLIIYTNVLRFYK